MSSKARVAVSALFCSTLIIGSYDVRPAYAGDGGAAVAAGIAGFAIGVMTGAAARSAPRNRSTGSRSSNRSSGTRSTSSRSSSSTQAARSSADVIAVQKALAHFGYYKGAIDGRSGPQTRAAISDLQTQQEWPVTGQLTDDQKKVLLTNYADAQNGQSAPAAVDNQAKVDQLFAMINGPNPGAGTGAGPTVSPIPATGVVSATGGVLIGGNTATPQPTVTTVAASMDGFGKHCPDAATAAAPTGGALAVSGKNLVPDQFCNARSAALLRSAETFAKLQGVDVASVQAECSRIAESMQANRLGLLTAEPDVTIDKISAEFKTAGVGDEQIPQAISNFTVCLGVGYANDRADVVVSAALSLVGLGEAGYGELVAGALALGAGTEKNNQKAVAWLDYTAAEIEAGATPVSQDAGVERAAILRLVSTELVGGTGDSGGKVVLASNNTPTPVIETAVITPPLAEEEPETPATDEPATGGGDAVVAMVEPPQVDEPAPTGDRKKDAQAFFEREKAEQAKQLEALMATLEMTPDSVAATCGTELASLSGTVAPVAAEAALTPGSGIMLRVCRSWAYAMGDNHAMYWFDRALSDGGDVDAEARMGKHLLLGHDRQQAAVTQ